MERLPNPRLVTDSMASGGVPRERYSQSAPGSQSIEDYTMPAAAGFNDLTDVPQVSATVIVSDESGRVTGNARPAQGGPWKQATSSAAGWDQL